MPSPQAGAGGHKLLGAKRRVNKITNMKSNIYKFSIVSLFFSFLLAGCVFTGSYQSPFLIGVSVNSEGQVNVGLSPSISTPIGTFTLSGETTVMSLRDIADKRLLIIRVDTQATVYTLEEGKEFNVEFKDNGKLYSQVNLVYEADGDIVLELESVKNPAIPTNTMQVLPATQAPPAQENLGDNLVLDGNFENGLGGWNYSERHVTGLTYPAAGYIGNGVCSRQNLTPNDQMGWVGIGRDVSVQAGKSYKYSAWVKWENATEFNVHIEWGNPIQYAFFQKANGTEGNWQLWEGVIAAPAESNQIRLAFWHGVLNNSENVPNGVICVDEVSLREIK